MLMSTLADRYAHRLLDARARARCIAPLSAAAPLSLADAYDIAQRMLAIRTAQGETAIGRKIGFLTPGMTPAYGAPHSSGTLFWGHLFDATVRYVDQGDRKSNRMSTSMAHVWGVSGMHTGDCWVDFSKPVARDFSV